MVIREKLVRDKIPDLIKQSGGNPKTHVVSGNELFGYLDKKLDEEVNEFHKDKNLEELADILEVITGLAKHMGYSEEQLFDVRNKKREERGGFVSGIVLEI